MKTTQSAIIFLKKGQELFSILDEIMQSAIGKHKENKMLLLIVYCEMISHYYYHYFLTYLCLDTVVNIACSFIMFYSWMGALEYVVLQISSFLFLQESCPFRSPSSLHLCKWYLEIKWTHFVLPYKFLLSWFGCFILVCQDNLEFCFCHPC